MWSIRSFFLNMTSHSMAVANKLKDMDIELVILAGYDMPLGVIPYQFKNHIIGTFRRSIPRSRTRRATCSARYLSVESR